MSNDIRIRLGRNFYLPTIEIMPKGRIVSGGKR